MENGGGKNKLYAEAADEYRLARRLVQHFPGYGRLLSAVLDATATRLKGKAEAYLRVNPRSAEAAKEIIEMSKNCTNLAAELRGAPKETPLETAADAPFEPRAAAEF